METSISIVGISLLIVGNRRQTVSTGNVPTAPRRVKRALTLPCWYSCLYPAKAQERPLDGVATSTEARREGGGY